METVSYIIGDIHGQADLLEQLLANIESRHNWKYPSKAGKLVYLGDYIDRGSNSLGVIDLAIKGIPNFSSIYLKGNHEEFLLKALMSEERAVWNNWMSAGGETTLKSFGYDLFLNKFDSQILKDCLGKERISWLNSLDLTYQFSDVICVHAGFLPETPISEQSEKDMLWIRKRFLDSNHDFGYGVIHGHTPDKRPVVKPNRICVDTGAGMGGELTALIIDKPWHELRFEPEFISAS